MIINADVLQWCRAYTGPKFHAMLCDPPYHLTEINNRSGKQGSAPAQYGKDGAFQRMSKGFMGKEWDGGDVAFRAETWAAIKEHLYPGAWCMAFASTRGVHRMAVAIEDAGFIIHPTIFCWVFGSGFPKATRIDVQIDRASGAERPVIGQKKHAPKFAAAEMGYREKDNGYNSKRRETFDLTGPATDMAAAWEGHRYGGQAMKPASEPLVVFRKPLTAGTSIEILGQITILLEMCLCTHLPAPDADAATTQIHRILRRVVADFVRGSADASALLDNVIAAAPPSGSNRSMLTLRDFVAGPALTLDAMRQQGLLTRIGKEADTSAKDTHTFNETARLLPSIVRSWKRFLADLSEVPSTCIIETATNLITDLRTLRCSLSEIMHESIAQEEPTGRTFHAVTAVECLASALGKLPLLTSTIAIGSATEAPAEPDDAQEDGDLQTVLVFQKPFEGRPVACMMQTGAGGLWIDGGRIGTDDDLGGGIYGGIFGTGAPAIGSGDKGRWPANFILGHHPECDAECVEGCPVRLLDEQSGVRKRGGPIRESPYQDSPVRFTRGTKIRVSDDRFAGEEGTAARFFYQADWSYEIAERLAGVDPVFYCAKASNAERDAGLEAFPPIVIDDGRDKSIDNAYQRGKTSRLNPHPTIKNIRLTHHLATLLLPPAMCAPRRILIPFAGVASEYIGAMKAGWEEIVGVELTTEYVPYAEARIEYWRTHDAPPSVSERQRKQDADENEPEQLGLFGEAA